MSDQPKNRGVQQVRASIETALQESRRAPLSNWRWVPTEATPAMLEAGQAAGKNCAWSYAACWAAMLGAAPSGALFVTSETRITPDEREALRRAAETGELHAELPGGELMLINRGEDYDNADLHCPACGGSGHKDDAAQPPQASGAPALQGQAVAWRRATKYGWEFRANAPTKSTPGTGWIAMCDLAASVSAQQATPPAAATGGTADASDARDAALERAAVIAESFGPSRPMVSSNPSVIVRGRWEGEQAASTNIAAAIRAIKAMAPGETAL